MADLLDRIHAELKERLQASRAAVQEYEQLQAALAALGAPKADVQPVSVPDGTASSRAANRRQGIARSRPAGTRRTRAPRGQNRERVVATVRDRPGVTPLELAAASGVKGPTLYTVLRRLVTDGTLERRDLPGGDKGYAVTDGQ